MAATLSESTSYHEKLDQNQLLSNLEAGLPAKVLDETRFVPGGEMAVGRKDDDEDDIMKCTSNSDIDGDDADMSDDGSSISEKAVQAEELPLIKEARSLLQQHLTVLQFRYDTIVEMMNHIISKYPGRTRRGNLKADLRRANLLDGLLDYGWDPKRDLRKIESPDINTTSKWFDYLDAHELNLHYPEWTWYTAVDSVLQELGMSYGPVPGRRVLVHLVRIKRESVKNRLPITMGAFSFLNPEMATITEWIKFKELMPSDSETTIGNIDMAIAIIRDRQKHCGLMDIDDLFGRPLDKEAAMDFMSNWKAQIIFSGEVVMLTRLKKYLLGEITFTDVPSSLNLTTTPAPRDAEEETPVLEDSEKETTAPEGS
ncbi:hypothetical protein NA57DRAFT_75925 [Rhizodiscina lignyota]|uniref:Uncharacterized protein n=1 Tax=Rhizodiscina lignyota TaxID=1504668 RepID=A0A9P4IHR4_9PEZI|nr:hypothetical protein NA57DRAFT_75925 [Rhizodiscina lignyota]